MHRRGAAARAAAAGAAALAVLTVAACGSSGDSGPAQEDAGQSGAAQPASPEGDEASAAQSNPELYDTPAHRMIEDALAGKAFIRCEAQDSADTVTAYVHGEDRMRIDGGTGPDAGHLLTVDGTTYVWSDDRPGGMKTTGKAADGMKTMVEGMGVNLDAARQVAGEQGQAIDEDATLGCSEYTGDESVFAVPEGREFTVVDDALKAATGGGGD